MSLLVAVFALASARVASANFAPPPVVADPRPVGAADLTGGAPAVAAPSAPAPSTESAPNVPPAAVVAPPAAAPAAAPANQQPIIAPAPVQPITQPAPRPLAAPEMDEEESLRAFAEENPTPHTKLNVAAWIGTGVTVALLGVAAFYGAKAGEKASDVDRLTRSFDPVTDLPVEYATVADQYTSAVRDGKHDARVAKGVAIAAGATAVVSAALFIIDAVRKPGQREGSTNHALLTPIVTAQSAGLGLGGTF